jgi:hypothetical protein
MCWCLSDLRGLLLFCVRSSAATNCGRADAPARTTVRYSLRLYGMNENRLGGRVRAEKNKACGNRSCSLRKLHETGAAVIMLHLKEVVYLDFGQQVQQEGFLYELGSLLGWQSGTLVWMLYGFFDESGEHADGRLIRLTIGGGLATFDTWQALTKNWIEVLANQNIKTFHAADDKNNELLMQDIYRAIDKHPMLWMFGTTHAGQNENNLLKEAYGKGAIEMLKMVHRQAETEHDEFQIVFAELKDFRIGRIAKYCEKLKSQLPLLNGWSSSRPQTCGPLQLADLVAHAVKCDATGDHRYVKRLKHKHSFHIFPSQP